jgi:hypothetical protein
MDAKEKLKNILEENRKLKEELKMVKTHKENNANSDTQVAPAQLASKGDGSPLDAKNASQDDLAKKYAENEADKDVQAQAKQPVSGSDGNKDVKADAANASQDDLSKKYPVSKMEAEGDGIPKVGEQPVAKAEEGKAIEDKPEVDITEKYKEMEGDMGKLVEIVGALKSRIEALEAKGKTEAATAPVQGQEKPEPPMTENVNLRNVFVETIKTDAESFGKIVRNVIY